VTVPGADEPQLGAVIPQTEIGAGPEDVRTFVAGAEACGMGFLTVYDHVVGADRAAHPGWSGTYDSDDLFHEPFVLLGYLAGCTRLDLATGVLVLPQRQTTLVAKQAAEVDVLSGGRLRLGVGIGWNHVEYEALDEDFHTRGRRIEEQIDLLRRLWTEPVVRYEGRWHRVTGAGLNPLPVQRPIPVWLAAGADERAMRRVGRLADGWLPMLPPGPDFAAARALVDEGARAAGRDPAEVGLEGRLGVGDGDMERIARVADAWRAAGARRIALNTLGASLGPIEAHVERLAAAADRVRQG
jgi:probable F420-dependent oxidoreductase